MYVQKDEKKQMENWFQGGQKSNGMWIKHPNKVTYFSLWDPWKYFKLLLYENWLDFQSPSIVLDYLL